MPTMRKSRGEWHGKIGDAVTRPFHRSVFLRGVVIRGEYLHLGSVKKKIKVRSIMEIRPLVYDMNIEHFILFLYLQLKVLFLYQHLIFTALLFVVTIFVALL